MAFFIENQKIRFHKTYLDRVPKRYLPVYSGSALFDDVTVTLNVRRNTAGTKFYWIFVFLGRTFVFWSELFDTAYVGEFNNVCYAYVCSLKYEISKSHKVCNVLTQKSFA